MQTHFCIINEQAETVFSGSLNECSTHVRTLMQSHPGAEFVICKVSPVSWHKAPALTLVPDAPLTLNNIIQFPVRRELMH